jgi:heptaprenyl diphosphate synthase
MKNNKTKKLSLTALFAVIALIIFIVEAQIPLSFQAPGIKLGLANIVTLFIISLGGMWKVHDVFMVFIVRVLLAALITGNPQVLIFSFTGGVLSIIAMLLFKKTPIPVISVAGGVMHNIGQIAVAVLLTGTSILVYLPVLIIGGIVSGLITGFTVYFIFKSHPKFINYIKR